MCRLFALIFVAGVLLAGCGQKGALYMPEATTQASVEQSTENDSAAENSDTESRSKK